MRGKIRKRVAARSSDSDPKKSRWVRPPFLWQEWLIVLFFRGELPEFLQLHFEHNWLVIGPLCNRWWTEPQQTPCGKSDTTQKTKSYPELDKKDKNSALYSILLTLDTIFVSNRLDVLNNSLMYVVNCACKDLMLLKKGTYERNRLSAGAVFFEVKSWKTVRGRFYIFMSVYSRGRFGERNNVAIKKIENMSWHFDESNWKQNRTWHLPVYH